MTLGAKFELIRQDDPVGSASSVASGRKSGRYLLVQGSSFASGPIRRTASSTDLKTRSGPSAVINLARLASIWASLFDSRAMATSMERDRSVAMVCCKFASQYSRCRSCRSLQGPAVSPAPAPWRARTMISSLMY